MLHTIHIVHTRSEGTSRRRLVRRFLIAGRREFLLAKRETVNFPREKFRVYMRDMVYRTRQHAPRLDSVADLPWLGWFLAVGACALPIHLLWWWKTRRGSTNRIRAHVKPSRHTVPPMHTYDAHGRERTSPIRRRVSVGVVLRVARVGHDVRHCVSRAESVAGRARSIESRYEKSTILFGGAWWSLRFSRLSIPSKPDVSLATDLLPTSIRCERDFARVTSSLAILTFLATRNPNDSYENTLHVYVMSSVVTAIAAAIC